MIGYENETDTDIDYIGRRIAYLYSWVCNADGNEPVCKNIEQGRF